MNNELIQRKSWNKRNWKWFVPISGIILILITVFFSSGMGRITTDFVQAYADTELYEKALKKVTADKLVTDLLGEIEPIGKMTIFKGDVQYSNDNQSENQLSKLVERKEK